jgi:hypothetical protein
VVLVVLAAVVRAQLVVRRVVVLEVVAQVEVVVALLRLVLGLVLCDRLLLRGTVLLVVVLAFLQRGVLLHLLLDALLEFEGGHLQQLHKLDLLGTELLLELLGEVLLEHGGSGARSWGIRAAHGAPKLSWRSACIGHR